MFTESELKNLFTILDAKATFTLSGQEADIFVATKLRVLEEIKKLTKVEETTPDAK